MTNTDEDTRGRVRVAETIAALVPVVGLLLLLGFLLRPARHEVATLLQVTRDPLASPQPEGDFSTFKRQQTELVRSSRVLKAALAQPEIAGLSKLREHHGPVAWLSHELIIDYPGDGPYLRIALRGSNRGQLAAIVNAVAAEYIKELEQREPANRGRVSLVRVAN